MANGIVVEHKETGIRYAVSADNYNSKVHHKVRDLKPGETVHGYQPRRKERAKGQGATQGTAEAAKSGKDDAADASEDTRSDHKTEGSPTGGTKDSK